MLTELNAGSRVYCFQFAPFFAAAGIKATFCPPSSTFLFKLCHREPRNLPDKLLLAFLRRFYWYLWVPLRRLAFIALVPFYDLVFVQRGLLQHCSRPWLEMLLYRWAGVWGKKVVYCIDDPIYVDCPDYIHSVIEKADVVLTVNEKLAEYTLQYNPNVIMFEDAVNLDRYPLKDRTVSQESVPLVIGWVGNAITGPRYLSSLREPLLELFHKYPNLVFRVVSGQDFQFQAGVPVDNVRWRLDYEASVTFDIGLAPLLDSDYDQAKASFKVLQYWAHGIPVVCSQTADNFLKDGMNCMIARNPEEWSEKLGLLIENPELCREMGMRGRRLIETRFALSVKGPIFASILEGIARNSSQVPYFQGQHG